MWQRHAVFLAVVVALDLVVWAAYRFDKRAARRGWRRLSERLLLALTLVGGIGALLGMYAHRQRHKTRKWYFVAVAIIAVIAQLAILYLCLLQR